MRSCSSIVWALIFATVLVSPPGGSAARSSPRANQAPTESRFDFKFAPPLGRTLRFQLSLTQYHNGKAATVQPLVWVEELRYEKAEKGYTLYWRMDGASLPAAMRSPLVTASIKQYTGDPIAFDVDADGNILRIRDWEHALAGFHTDLATARTMLLRQPGAQPDIVDKTIAAMTRHFDDLTAESAPDLILRNISPILGFGSGLSLTSGETRERKLTYSIALYATSLVATDKITLVSVDSQMATISDRQSIDPAELKRLEATIAAATGQSVAAAPNSLNIATSTDATIDVPTGLVARFDAQKRMGDNGPMIERRQINWLR